MTQATVYSNEYQDTSKFLGSGTTAVKFFRISLVFHNLLSKIPHVGVAVNVSENDSPGAGRDSMSR